MFDYIGQWAALTVLGFAYYFVLAAGAYALFFVWRRERYNPDYRPDWEANSKGVMWSAISVAGNAALMVPLHVLSLTYGQVYWDVADHGWLWIGASALLMLFITETAIYWIHRGLHHKRIYTWFHYRHHRWRECTPWMSLSFNPLDSFAQALPHHLCAFLFPLHVGVYLVFLSFVTIWAVAIHDRVSLVRHPWLNYTGHHTIHHHYSKYNYGQFFTFWDRLGGTYRAPVGEVFLRPNLS